MNDYWTKWCEKSFGMEDIDRSVGVKPHNAHDQIAVLIGQLTRVTMAMNGYRDLVEQALPCMEALSEIVAHTVSGEDEHVDAGRKALNDAVGFSAMRIYAVGMEWKSPQTATKGHPASVTFGGEPTAEDQQEDDQ